MGCLHSSSSLVSACRKGCSNYFLVFLGKKDQSVFSIAHCGAVHLHFTSGLKLV